MTEHEEQTIKQFYLINFQYKYKFKKTWQTKTD